MALPRHVVLKSNYDDKYLRYVHEDVEVHGFLQFSGEEVVSPYSKYEVELAKSDKRLVHIRCCYNNKYWVRWSQNHWWIVAGASEPDEDQSSWSCTLFQPLYIDGDAQTLRLRHVQLGHYACLWRIEPPYSSCLFAGSASPDKDLCDVYTIIDWEKPLILPKDIAFKGNNGYDLRARTSKRHTYPALPRYVVLKSIYDNNYLRYIHEDVEVHGFLQFSGEEVGSPYSKYEVELAKSDKGLVHIRCCYNNKYWVRWSKNHWWIVAGADEPDEDQSSWSCTLFQPLYIDGDAQTLRLRHVQLGHYACLWRAAPPYASCLFAGSASPDKDFCDVYTIIDGEKPLILPKYIALKGDNGYNLRARTSKGHTYPALPRYVVLKSNYNNKYLRYIHEDVEVHGFLRFSGEGVVNPYSKYEVELAKSDKGLVHIRCCYNNKYWVRWSKNHWWIVAGADEPDEDQSSWSCTLFQPLCVDGDAQTLRLRHVQLGHYACLWEAAPPYASCLFAGSASPDKDLCDVYTIIDWETLLILPKHIAFKGDNGYYLRARKTKRHTYLEFASSDIGDPSVGHEVFTTPDGSVRIKSDYSGKFWRRSPDWIWAGIKSDCFCKFWRRSLDWICADSDDSTNKNPDTLFWPVRVDNNVVALRNFGNKNFCRILTTKGKTSGLNAAVPTISKEAHLEVAELVLSRNVYNVNFRLKDARIYDQSVLVMSTGQATNMTSQSNTRELKLTYTETKSRTWTGSVSLKLGVKLDIKSGIPFISQGEFGISAEFNGTYEWGETESTTTTLENVYTVTVPPMTRVTVSMLATQGSCDVPFSYSQRDTLTNGKHVIYNMDDGVYTGINCYNLKYETKEEKL